MKPFAETAQRKPVTVTPRFTARWVMKAAVCQHMAFYRCKAIDLAVMGSNGGIHRA